MQVNKYLFCGCAIELKSEEPIIREREFSAFLSDYSVSDFSINVIKSEHLPAKNGKEIYISNRKKVFFDGKTRLYTSYFNTKERCYTDYACKVDNTDLYISYPGELRETPVFDALNLPSVLLEKNIGVLHCSFIEYQGCAILFAGDKQVGKSTQAALWKELRNAETINGDRAALSVENGIICANGIPFCGTSKICKNKKLPLKAIICLSKGSSNKLEWLSPAQAFMFLLGKFTYDFWDEKASERIAEIVKTIAERVPVCSYSCLKDASAVEVLESELLKL